MQDINSSEIQQLITEKINELRKRLLDLSRRNWLLNTHFRHNSTSILRVVDELPDVLHINLENEKPMRLVPLPPLEEELPDEKTDEFLDALFLARKEDREYRSAIDSVDELSVDSEETILKIERELKDRIREQLELPPRQTTENLSIIQHAKNHGIDPSYILPLPEDVHEDGRHHDTEIQTLMLPDRLARVAKGILEKSHSFERETGVNVLHVAFGFLEWKDPIDSKPLLSPLLLQEIRIERKQSPKGAQFYISRIDGVSSNTTLAQKLLMEYGLSIPTYDESNVEDYFFKIQESSPSGSHWKVRREVAIGIFPSSKIAMYKDLDPETRPIAVNDVVARLMATAGSGDGSYAEVYETDNPEVWKKVPYLIADADASQYSALVDVANGQNISIEGPPGSGKSQSIVNLIAAAIADGKKVLFVAEKLTALDVVKNRLEAARLGEFILPLQAGRGTREKVYESLQARINLQHGSDHGRDDFQRRQNLLVNSRTNLQEYLDALASSFGDTGMTVYQVIGHGISTAEIRSELPKEVRRIKLNGIERFSPGKIEKLLRDAEVFADQLDNIHRMPKLWLASDAVFLSHDEVEDAADEVGQLARDMQCLAEDIAVSKLAPFLDAALFSFDLVGLRQLLKTIITAEQIDPVLIENLTSTECRRDVLKLCGQIQEYRSIQDHLSRVLKESESWNIDKRIESAHKFANEIGGKLSPKKHRVRIAEIEEQIANFNKLIEQAKELPVGWTDQTGITLRSIGHDAKRLIAFPESVRTVRRGDESRQSSKLTTEITDRIRMLVGELARIRQTLPKADNDDPAQIRRIARVIAESGIFRFLSGEYKSARNTYCNMLGGSAKDNRRTMAQHLEDYASWLNTRKTFENDTRFSTVFGDLFRGLGTRYEEISQLSAFHSCCQEIANNDSVLQKALETGDLSSITAFSLAENLPEISLSELKKTRDNNVRLLEEEKNALKEAVVHADLFLGSEGIDIAEIEEIIAHKSQQKYLNSLIESSDAASVLGPHFSSNETRIDILKDACIQAEILSTTPNSALATSILRSGDGQELFEELNEYQPRFEQIEKNTSEICSRLKLHEDLHSPTVLFARMSDLQEAAENPEALFDRARLKKCEDTLRSQGLDVLVNWVKQEGDDFDPLRLGSIVHAIIVKNMSDCAFEFNAKVMEGYDGQDLDRLRKEIANKDRELIQMSRNVIRNRLLANAQPPSGNSVGKKSTYTEMSLILNEINKKRRHIPTRELTHRAGNALLELKPCWMMSPLAVAQFLHDDIEFDLVVVDEASQMTPENAIGALSRGRQAVIVGDTKQLPPTSFFQKILDEDDIDEDLREESESILDKANLAFMPIRQLRWHYRSKHSGLIQFSNENMYDGKLTIFPSAYEGDEDLGVRLVEVDGVYKSRRNLIEARHVVDAARLHMEQKPHQSLGICTMNTDQKELILEEFERERERNPKIQAYIVRWETENDALEEFFIKNLETIQGDERDVIFISTLYGPEAPGGRVLQRFGPINSIHGHRRLNVLFTRAKRKMVTFTSLKPADIIVDDRKHSGVKIFRDWLEYCKTGNISSSQQPSGETESPFEDYVARQIEALGCFVTPQVGVRRFRVDLGVEHPDWPYGFILGVECDGATYHSSKSSRDRDRIRQEILEGLGWKLHRIWSTDWFRHPKNEIEKLRAAIDKSLSEAKKKHVVQNPKTEVMGVDDTADFDVEEPGNVIPTKKVNVDGSEHSASGNIPREPRKTAHNLHKKRSFDHLSNDPAVSIGSKVVVEHLTDNKVSVFTLVEEDNDSSQGYLQGYVHIHTPIGKALIDSRVGDEIEFQVGSVIKKARLLRIL